MNTLTEEILIALAKAGGKNVAPYGLESLDNLPYDQKVAVFQALETAGLIEPCIKPALGQKCIAPVTITEKGLEIARSKIGK